MLFCSFRRSKAHFNKSKIKVKVKTRILIVFNSLVAPFIIQFAIFGLRPQKRNQTNCNRSCLDILILMGVIEGNVFSEMTSSLRN